MRVFLLAAGSSKRFNGTIKQLLPIDGEPLIRRTIRMIREFDNHIPIYVVTWHDELKFPDVIVVDTKTRPRQLQNTILATEPYWGDRNVFLLADVIFDKTTLRKILSYSGDPVIFAADKCPAKSHSERFALTFPRVQSERIKDLCSQSAQLFEGTSMENHGGLGKLCFSTRDTWKIPFISPLTPTTPFWRFVRPARDYLIFNIYPHFWKPSPPLSLILVDGNLNTDIDTEEEYKQFCDREMEPGNPNLTTEIQAFVFGSVAVYIFVLAEFVGSVP